MTASDFVPANVSKQVPVLIPAGNVVNGQVIPAQIQVAATGDRFYVLATSSQIGISAQNAGGGQGFTNYFGNGQGQSVKSAFQTLIVTNSTASPVVALIWIGFDEFVNDQLVIANSAITNVAFPTQTALGAANINITDRSGTQITDINGVSWGAIARICILAFNTDAAATYLLQKYGANTANGPAVGVVFPLTPIRFDFSGNYCFNVGGAGMNLIVSEIYQCVPLTGLT